LTAQRVFHSKLLQTEKLAALGQMVSGVAHELSNPLTSIMGYAHRLLTRNDLPGRTEELRQIHQEAERASAILRQVLLNARETLPERRPVSLNQIVQRAMDLQRFSFAAEKIRVEIDLDPALPFVQGDAGHLQQVLMNLVGNARQPSNTTARAERSVCAQKESANGASCWKLPTTVPEYHRPSSRGFLIPFSLPNPPASHWARPGHRAERCARTWRAGARFEPAPGRRGFQIELPAAAETAREGAVGSSLPGRKNVLPEAAEAAGRENRFAPAREAGKGARVLVVEDEPTVARLIADVLEDEGMVVDVLLDGREALGRAATQAFDLVICDMKMPGLDGQNFINRWNVREMRCESSSCS